MSPRGDERRQFPRRDENIAVHLRWERKDRSFNATVYTADISLSGVFFDCQFFLPIGMAMDLSFTMPGDDREVHTRGLIVREVRGGRDGRTGFAMHFTEYFGDAKSILAYSFLRVDVDDFIKSFMARPARNKSIEEQLRDALIAWEMDKLSFGDEVQALLRRKDAPKASPRSPSGAGRSLPASQPKARSQARKASSTRPAAKKTKAKSKMKPKKKTTRKKAKNRAKPAKRRKR